MSGEILLGETVPNGGRVSARRAQRARGMRGLANRFRSEFKRSRAGEDNAFMAFWQRQRSALEPRALERGTRCSFSVAVAGRPNQVQSSQTTVQQGGSAANQNAGA
jgi:hypothetical protein